MTLPDREEPAPHVCECKHCSRTFGDSHKRCRNCGALLFKGGHAVHKCPDVPPGPNCKGESIGYGLIRHKKHKWGDYCPMPCVRCDIPIGMNVECLTSKTNPYNAECDCGIKTKKGKK